MTNNKINYSEIVAKRKATIETKRNTKASRKDQNNKKQAKKDDALMKQIGNITEDKINIVKKTINTLNNNKKLNNVVIKQLPYKYKIILWQYYNIN